MAPAANNVRGKLEAREEFLSLYAKRSCAATRSIDELKSDVRTEFQRDRDRIIHSNAFRRLKHKTQVFIAPRGDHYVTRLTHTLEVSQIGRTIARALNLNEDLVEAMTLGHDIGHTPFGHAGEEVLNEMVPGGFSHASQSIRLVEVLEKEGHGLNLTEETKEGIFRHSKPKGNFLAAQEQISLESQICRLSDAIAYVNHDVLDALRAGWLVQNDLPKDIIDILGDRHSERVNTLVMDTIMTSSAVLEEENPMLNSGIQMSEEISEAMLGLRDYMFQNVYLPVGQNK
ncbi:MAG: deoxyguanosinetriphosphate triphosphohydrolase, partial [SAR202 cluster bacterium]|nr:deoxyguanosinetriphosphate triphosphohydrolase [SAR202 cluster bacterium]